jgi:hypothetical protein
MSTWFPEEVTCPACSKTFTARLAKGVHATRAPEVRDMMFARTFHHVTCPHCSGAFTVQRPLVYTDMDRKQWIQVALPVEKPLWPEMEGVADEVFDRAFTGSPLAEGMRLRFKRRLVFGLEDLREKLVIWRDSLDDAVVECLKIHAISRDPELYRATSIVVDEVVAGALRIVIDGDRKIELPAELVEQFHDDARLPGRFPELFGGRFVSYQRLLGTRYRWVEP